MTSTYPPVGSAGTSCDHDGAPLAPLLGGIVFGLLPSVVQYVQPSWIYSTGHKLPVRVDMPFTAFYIGPAPIVLGVVLVGAGLAEMVSRLKRA